MTKLNQQKRQKIRMTDDFYSKSQRTQNFSSLLSTTIRYDTSPICLFCDIKSN